ncbi:MAG TPA: gamma-glutamylcyclotransferase [Xanthobacteraceae bacterium]|nr:gamma-glutamylcyclotransferase [Xanthobacteraceae bacterium]
MPDSGLWIFGYGSLMWRTGFEYLERRPARLLGLHRALCVYSHFHRGTAEKPGLVLGLDRGGSCRGIAFRVEAGKREATIAYLREREQITSVYLETMRPIILLDEPESDIRALCYVVDRSHAQYAGALSRERQLALVRQGHGRSGAGRDYVLATVKELEALGIRDATLEWLAARL